MTELRRPGVIEQGATGPRLVLQGAWSPAAHALLRDSQATELELNYAKGWHGPDLGFLGDLPNLEVFEIIDRTIDNIAPVNTLVALKRLKVATYCKTELRFGCFPRLQVCSLEWRPRTLGLFEHQGIGELFINKYPGSDLTAFERMTALRSLSLASPRLETLGPPRLTNLRSLSIQNARRLTGIEGIGALARLQVLELSACTGIRSVDPISSCRELRELHLIDLGELDSISVVRELPELEVVLFYGSTNIRDGDLAALADLPKLTKVAFATRHHYSHTAAELA